MFESALEAGLTAAGVDTRCWAYADAGVAYLTRNVKGAGGHSHQRLA